MSMVDPQLLVGAGPSLAPERDLAEAPESYASCDGQLNGRWAMYYHLPQDKSWSLGSYKLVMGSIDSANKVVALANALSDPIVRYCMLFVMRVGVTPMWEDPKNRTGGAFSFKVANKHVPVVWRELLFAVCGETLMVDPAHNAFVNGITISPKKNFCILKLWMSGCNIQDPAAIVPILLLVKQGCSFKKHEAEF